ncbi:MAG: hypothetical protein ACKVJK_24240, partial [Methylophagaceae bacterium]
ANNYVLPFTNNSGNWNTAYGWGNHASAGYVTSSGNTIIGTDTDLSFSGANVLSTIALTDGVITAYTNRVLTLANLGYTGETNATADQSAAQILTAIKTVDGSGSGLDADLLDSQNGSYYTGAKGTNNNYVASSTSTSNRGNYGAGVWAYSGYSTGSDRPFTYDSTLQVMPAGNAGVELSVDWIGTTATPLKLRSLRDCCQGWSTYSTVWTSTSDGSGSGLDADLLDGQHGSYYRAYANLTGTPTIPSLSGYATESYVGTQISNLVDSSPAALNTLNELAAALGDDASFSTTVTNSIATKLPLAGGTLTNTLYARKDNVTNYTDANIRLDSYGGSSTTVGIGFHISSSIGKYLNMNSTGVLKWNSSTIWDTSTLTTTNKANYDTAYGWGNHASGGYAPASTTVTTTGNQSIDGIKTFTGTNVTLDNPANNWKYIRLQSAGSVKWDIATNEADDSSSLQFRAAGGGTNRVTVSQAGNLTATGTVTATGGNSTNWNTAYGWGNHASAGYT